MKHFVLRVRHECRDALLRRVFDALSMPVSLKPLDGTDEIVNCAWESATGIARVDILGKRHPDFADAPLLAHVPTTEARLLEGEEDSVRCDIEATTLTDIQMPIMDGYQLAAAIGQEHALTVKPVIVALTANLIVDHAESARAVGIHTVLQKPATVEKLRQMLKTSIRAQH